MLKQKFKHMISLYPVLLFDGWHIENISDRQEGEKWETLWFQVITPTGTFRVKEFFLDIMEPTFPDSCIHQAQGECFQYNGLFYWRGINYKGKDSYVISKWKTQVEVSIDEGFVQQQEMEQFLEGLQPLELEKAKQQVNKPFHTLSFQARVPIGGEISRCSNWYSPNEIEFSSLPITILSSWRLESIGLGRDEIQYVYWDLKEQLYTLWVCRHSKRSYYRTTSWIRNYGSVQMINGLEFYTHPQRGTVVYQDLGEEQIAYIFRGTPCSTVAKVKEIFS
ncbi:hypothetical protein QUF88_17420 [Bacillus sp. DX1.1]|uniref:hypothetical protein n=1 Tax=unclassified Bacillus (in: firmicutes) TaxID=185979 RepID=UPI00256FB02E|nr:MULTISPECIES: hypothetical protein [unclassified Bacillus (in: firmicutes)]MDM5155511.1 hypothetical protein [Bacillus sp. DX1.1]WJE79822.1 hypothetical protein QRE67_14945 [Bacillus sp. DX3.1]